MSENKSILKLQEILDNVPRELNIEGIGKVLVKDPTTQDRINARTEAMKDPRWNDLTSEERTSLVLEILAVFMIAEPKISIESYYKANTVILSNIINSVIIDYTVRYRKLENKRSSDIKAFLDLVKENNQESSTSS